MKTKKHSSGEYSAHYENVPEKEKRLVAALLSDIDRAKLLSKEFNEEKLPRLRKLVAGDIKSDGDGQTRTNMIFATAATLLPLTYAKDPEISVTIQPGCGKHEYEEWRKFSKTAQAFLNRMLVNEAGLKARAKSNVRSAMFTGVGWIKLIFQESMLGDPLMVRKENDIQDNIRRIEWLKERAGNADRAGHEAKQEELSVALRALRGSPEARLYKGFAIDRVKTEDVFILDESVVDFHDYVRAERIAHRIFYTQDQWEQTFGTKVPKGAIEYSSPDGSSASQVNSDGKKKCFYAGYEVWDKNINTIFTVAEGCPGYLRPPFTPHGMSERWYSFFALGFNLLEGRWRPISDVELLEHLQKEYNDTRYLYAEARKEAIPVWVFRKSGNLTEADVDKLVNRRARQWIGIEGNPQVPLKDDVLQMPGISIDPNAYDVTIIRADMDLMVGLSDASRSNLVQAKTATEAEIMRQALQNRVAERQDTNEDMINEMAKAALEIGLQKFSAAEIKELLGEDAYWPAGMGIDQIFNKVSVQVRAGSTGKPDLIKERETWKELMGIVNDTVTQVAELRANGQFDLATAKVELLRETLRRFDDNIDVDAFIPPLETGEDGKPVAQTNALMQAQQMQEQMQALQDELQKCQQELQAAQQDALTTRQQLDGLRASNDVQIAEANAKQQQAAADAAREETTRINNELKAQGDAAQAAAKAQADADAQHAIEQDKIAAEDARHEREMERDRYKILIEAATKVVTSVMTEEARARAAAAKAEDDVDEGSEGKIEHVARVLDVVANGDDAPDGSLDGVPRQVKSKLDTALEEIRKLAEQVGGNMVTKAERIRGPDGKLLALRRVHANGKTTEIPIQ